ncbi:SDR family oxidoreductase [Rhizobium rhizogenes]|uniref:SDR family oxidoreductase n=1 Tax=Rhizobium rhizogenes TaxID=359 RepID=UPI0022BE3775|nr:SDR family oxidoreductase [Rhizobium rhizogenes]MCZ7486219.1 SDR family oxidoreductase [Rhizobium rhizogenes]
MRVFLTGATGFIGSHILPELMRAGHEVVGLTRSEAGGKVLAAAGASAHFGTIEDPASVAAGTIDADAVIHTAFDHDFSRFVENCEKDARVIAAIGAAVANSGKPFLITSGVRMGNNGSGKPATEDVVEWNNPNPRIASEKAGQAAADGGASVGVVRLPQVHNTEKQGLVSPMIGIAREKGISGYVGDGSNGWAAAHVMDVARLYVLALEKHQANARYNASAEVGVSTREIAEVVGKGLNVPVKSFDQSEAGDHFGWMTHMMGLDMSASSDWTRSHLGWKPTGDSLIADLQMMDYGAVVAE